MPTVAVKPTRVAIDWLNGDKFTRLMKTWRFHFCITVSRQEYRDDVPSLHLIANKTLKLVYEIAPECTILKFSGMGNIAPFQGFFPQWGGAHPCQTPPPQRSTPTAFWQIEHWVKTRDFIFGLSFILHIQSGPKKQYNSLLFGPLCMSKQLEFLCITFFLE